MENNPVLKSRGFDLEKYLSDKHYQNQINNATLQDALIIPNETTGEDETNIHKGKKLNYICSINPIKLTKLSGTITDNNGTSIFRAEGRIIAEFVIIPRDD